MPTAATIATTAAGIHHPHGPTAAKDSNAAARAANNATQPNRINAAPSHAAESSSVSVASGRNTKSEPGVLGGRRQEGFQVITPLRRCGLVRLDAGVVAAVEQQ